MTHLPQRRLRFVKAGASPRAPPWPEAELLGGRPGWRPLCQRLQSGQRGLEDSPKEEPKDTTVDSPDMRNFLYTKMQINCGS